MGAGQIGIAPETSPSQSPPQRKKFASTRSGSKGTALASPQSKAPSSRAALSSPSARPQNFQQEMDRLRTSNVELKSAIFEQKREKERVGEEVEKLKQQVETAERSRAVVRPPAKP